MKCIYSFRISGSPSSYITHKCSSQYTIKIEKRKSSSVDTFSLINSPLFTFFEFTDYTSQLLDIFYVHVLRSKYDVSAVIVYCIPIHGNTWIVDLLFISKFFYCNTLFY